MTGTGGLISDGAVDANYKLVASVDPNYPGPAAVAVTQTEYPFRPGEWRPNGPASRWIGPKANIGTFDSNSSPAGKNTYELKFTATGDVAGVFLTGRIAADDSVTVQLNGQDVLLTSTTPGYSSLTPFVLTSAIKAGDNILDFTVTNATLGGYNGDKSPTGLRVEFDPLAVPDAFTTGQGRALRNNNVLANDPNPAPSGTALTAVQASQPANGTVTVYSDGSFTYTPNTGFVGSDSFTYQAVDAYGAQSIPTTVTITITQVKVVLTDAGGNEIPAAPILTGTLLKVAKWENAFVTNPDGTISVVAPDAAGNDFIDLDPDRFNVRVYDPAALAAGETSVEVTIDTKNVAGLGSYDEAPTVEGLVPVPAGTGGPDSGPGWFWSNSQLLVSNTVDDTVGGAGVPAADFSNTKGGSVFPDGHRTHLIALRGVLTATYSDGGDSPSASSPVLVRNTVKVNVTILLDKPKAAGGTPVIDPVAAGAAFQKANEQLAQVGIRLVPQFYLVDPANTPGVNLADGLDTNDSNRVSTAGASLTPEERALLDAPGIRTPAANDVELYFVNYCTDRRAESLPPRVTTAPSYLNSVIVGATIMTPFTVAHEIGHLLTNANHYVGVQAGMPSPVLLPGDYTGVSGGLPTAPDLMRDGGTNTADAAVTDSKRLTAAQETMILANTAGLLNPP